MKELWLGAQSRKGELPTYIVRFTTDNQEEYEVLRDVCRQVLDTDNFRTLKALKELKKLCKKSK